MCIDDTILIRLLSGEIDEPQRCELLLHLETCADCSARWQQLRSTWDLLGQWNAPAGTDLKQRILSEARRTSGSRRWLPIAASILIAAGAGVVAGIIVPPAQIRPIAGQVTDQQVVDALGLENLVADQTPFLELFPSDAADQPQEDRS